jgi:3-oxoadipate enol-lactonase
VSRQDRDERAMPYAVVSRGSRLHYRTAGTEGPWVVLLMGLGASSHMWLDVPDRLARESPRYRVLTVDLLGTGESDPLTRPCSLRTMARHVVAAMDAAGVGRAYVVGLSMGGMVAQHVAIDHGHRLEGLVLMATTPGLVYGGLPTPRALRSLIRVSLGRSEQIAEAMVADLILPRMQRHRAREMVERLRDAHRAAPTQTQAFVWHLLACTLHSTGRDLRRIRAPTVVVTGDDDIVMGRRASRALVARIPGATLEVVPSCGHGISFTHPEAVRRALARLRSGGAAEAAHAG